jgi:hypothetical protein
VEGECMCCINKIYSRESGGKKTPRRDVRLGSGSW